MAIGGGGGGGTKGVEMAFNLWDYPIQSFVASFAWAFE
jgi:hypothetical protein